VFLALGDQAVACGLGEEVRRECLRFADEERMHGLLCGAAVVAFGEEAIGPQSPRAAFPQHESAPPRARVIRNFVSVCCMSETVAVSLKENRQDARDAKRISWRPLTSWRSSPSVPPRPLHPKLPTRPRATRPLLAAFP
jgi:hypothetical protein